MGDGFQSILTWQFCAFARSDLGSYSSLGRRLQRAIPRMGRACLPDCASHESQFSRPGFVDTVLADWERDWIDLGGEG
jgi:hypothetical protein